jgi:steroid delta-isomerase-like uncharacterized protein
LTEIRHLTDVTTFNFRQYVIVVERFRSPTDWTGHQELRGGIAKRYHPQGNDVMGNDRRNVVQRFILEAFNGGDIRVLPELLAPDHVSHLPNGDHYGTEGVRIDISSMRSAFPDLEISIIEMRDFDDIVVTRFSTKGTHEGPIFGFTGTGRHVSIEGIGIDRFLDGKIVERWVQYDAAGLLQQIGAIPGYSSFGDDAL